MYARSPRMDTLQVPASRYAIKIQPMDVPMPSDDDEECGLGYQNTLVSIKNTIRLQYRIILQTNNESS